MRCLEASSIMAYAYSEVPKIGQQYLLRVGHSYDLTALTSQGDPKRSLLNITNKQHHEVRPWDSDSKIKVVRSEKME